MGTVTEGQSQDGASEAQVPNDAGGAAGAAEAEAGDGQRLDAGTSVQQDVMSDVLEMVGDGKPAKQEPKGQPDGAEAADAGKKKETEAPAPDAQKKDEGGEKDPSKKQDDAKDLIEVPTEDGVKKVPLKNLVTTYTQHRHLQAQHERVKPFFELAKQSKTPVEKLYDYLVLGIQTAYSKKSGQPAPGAQSAQQGQASGGEYQGPFANAEDDARIKEVDPVLHASSWNLHRRNQRLEQMVQGLAQRLDGHGSRGADNGREREQYLTYKSMLEKKIADFAGQHGDYFAADPATKTSERLELFKQFLGKNYGHLDIERDITPEMLSIAFQTFDPAYVSKFMREMAQKTTQELLAQERKIFGESNATRTGSPGKQLSDEQQIMSEMLH